MTTKITYRGKEYESKSDSIWTEQIEAFLRQQLGCIPIRTHVTTWSTPDGSILMSSMSDDVINLVDIDKI